MLDTFLPGVWKDIIDVNDFINLNKKPFLNSSFFRKEEFNFESYIHFLREYDSSNAIKEFENEKLLSIKFMNEELSSFLLKEKTFPFPFGKEKNFSSLFNETSSLSLKNASRIGLLEKKFGEHIPPVFSPDIRQLPLYGIKRIIQTKRQYLKRSENDYQSAEWIEKRIDYFRQIEHLENFEKQYSFLSKEHAKNSKEVLNLLLFSCIYSMKENPFTTFHTPSILEFIDIYFENELLNDQINENEMMSLLTEFFTKLIFIHLFFKKQQINFLTLETIFMDFPTRTNQLFLDFYSVLEEFKFPLSIISFDKSNESLVTKINILIQINSPLRFIHNRLLPNNHLFSLSHLGFPFESDKDIILYNKPCESTKLFYLTLNGGKDVPSNYNLVPVYHKFDKDEIEFDMFWETFVDYVSQVFTIYSESNNLLMYLSEKYFSHPFRNSFKQSFSFYHYYFPFLNVDRLAIYLLSIKEKAFILKRDDKGFVVDFQVTKTFSNDQISQMILDISYLFDEEIKKTPYYQQGKPYLFLHLKKPLVSHKYSYEIFPPEMIPIRFVVENVHNIETYDDILILSKLHILDISI